jgi:hypothetical protein
MGKDIITPAKRRKMREMWAEEDRIGSESDSLYWMEHHQMDRKLRRLTEEFLERYHLIYQSFQNTRDNKTIALHWHLSKSLAATLPYYSVQGSLLLPMAELDTNLYESMANRRVRDMIPKILSIWQNRRSMKAKHGDYFASSKKGTTVIETCRSVDRRPTFVKVLVETGTVALKNPGNGFSGKMQITFEPSDEVADINSWRAPTAFDIIRQIDLADKTGRIIFTIRSGSEVKIDKFPEPQFIRDVNAFYHIIMDRL